MSERTDLRLVTEGDEPAAADETTGSVGQKVLGLVIGVFVLGGLTLAAGYLFRPGTEDPDPRHAVAESAVAQPDGTFLVTLDVSALDYWVPFDFAKGQLSNQPESAELLIKRFKLRAPHGAVKLGPMDLGDARMPAAGDWLKDSETGGEVQNPAFEGWYSYSYWTHWLKSHGDVFAIRRADGAVVFLRIESYNCDPEGSGCLTLRYRLAA
ncbi:MAG: hypothetical protein AAF533_25020 [Acidobacteriota bacterium]